jgi:hypothetical protein
LRPIDDLLDANSCLFRVPSPSLNASECVQLGEE